ncbi:hypothetical protein [Pseudoramibacter faecis]|uniref:hypothetical protein n=1 Tax=Pseudoramibacter faecis TaxID=3108534 RepID=UPI002E7981FB|nr:hypothetical protein [Pseudoramibacter sp. HA2172]
MNNFDDLFENGGNTEFPDQPFDKDAWAEKKQAERQEVYALADETTREVSTDGERYKAFLDVKARLIHYTATNTLLVLAQKPMATQLKEFDAWKGMGASIRKEETHIKILEPGSSYERQDGSIGTGFNVKHVFDISQTTAKPRQRPNPVRDDRQLLSALIHKAPVQIQGVDELPDGMGELYDHAQDVIFVRRGMEAHDIFRSLSKELAHAELAYTTPDYNRQDVAFAAYSASYVVCRRYGVDVSGYNFTKMPERFQEADPKDIRAELSAICDTAKEITGRMHRELEKDKAPKNKDKER